MHLQLVVDDRLKITSVYSGFPGCTHDARVLRNSALFDKCESGQVTLLPGAYIVADSAYPVKKWLICPFRDNGRLTARQHRLNRVLSSQRQCVIGHLKGPFRRIREIPMHTPKDICTLIVAACILHNICINANDHINDYIVCDDMQHPNNYPNVFANCPDGTQKRNAIMNALP